MIVVRTKKEILWTLICAFSGLALGAMIHFTPIFNTFGTKTERYMTVIVDAGHRAIG